jgi:hypothetical protein
VVHFSWGMGEAKKSEAKSVFFKEEPSLLKKVLACTAIIKKALKRRWWQS